MSQPQAADADSFALLTGGAATAIRPAMPADVVGLRCVFAPESVAVVGASRRRGTVGRAILDNIRGNGFGGRVYAVNPRARQIGGERCLASPLDLPEPVDLAVIAVPPPSVLDVVERCGQRGVRALAVITSELGNEASANLLADCRRHGMRLIGPNCFGVAVPAIGLNATLAASHPRPGIAGLVADSDGPGLAMLDQLSRLDIGISSFASVGDTLDVSGNDLLTWWEQDGRTRLAVLCTESFGNPRSFIRAARRVGHTMPVLTTHAGPASPGRSETGTHPPAATATVSRRALFEQAGIIAPPGMAELIEVTALLASQPVPTGRTVAIISNVGGAGSLAAEAAAEMGLTIHHPRGLNRRRLRALTPDGSVVIGPVNTTAAISAEAFRQCLELLAADDDVDAIIAAVLRTAATGDLSRAIQEAAIDVPLAAVLLDQSESVRLLPRRPVVPDTSSLGTVQPGPDAIGRVPAYCYPEAAARAVARAAQYGAWRAKPRGQVPVFPDIATGAARALVCDFTRRTPIGGWLSHGETVEILHCYGITLAKPTPDCDGTEVTIQVLDDDLFGPLVALRLGGGMATDPHSGFDPDRGFRLGPLSDADADELIRSIDSWPSPLNYCDASVGVASALRDTLLRVSRLAEDLPEITGLELNQVVGRPAAVVVVDARIKVAPHQPHDPFLRRLR